jgi:two-component system chemotaxis response regulator CheY
MRILIVDDDYVSRSKLKMLLSEYGDCDAVRSGELAVDMFAAAYQEGFPYSLITMDIAMPGMDGKEALHEILKCQKANNVPATEQVKVIMVTAKKDMKNVADSYYEGCAGYLTKPITPENIKKTLEEIGFTK